MLTFGILRLNIKILQREPLLDAKELVQGDPLQWAGKGYGQDFQQRVWPPVLDSFALNLRGFEPHKSPLSDLKYHPVPHRNHEVDAFDSIPIHPNAALGDEASRLALAAD